MAPLVMKKATIWISGAALVLIWGLMGTILATVRSATLMPVLLVGVIASIVTVVILTVIVRLGFYLALTIRAYRRGDLTLHRDARRWFIFTSGCVAYIVLGLSTLPFMRLPETINSIFVLTAGCAFLAVLVITYAFLESLALSVRQAVASYRSGTDEAAAK